MSIIVLILRIGLAGVFLTSALLKASDLDSFRRAIEAFGVHGKFVRPAAIALVVIELITGIALVPAATAWTAAAVALGLLTVFTVAVAVNLHLGRKVDCRCFGRLSAGPIGWSTNHVSLSVLPVKARTNNLTNKMRYLVRPACS